jgi:hypothetical protein
MGPKSRFDCQGRDENRVSTQIFGLLINQAPTDLRSNAVFKTVPAFFSQPGGVFLPVARAARQPSVTAMKADLRPVNAEGVISN